jgi:hypothetical protein
MSVTNLDTPVLDGGIHVTNFFNGRILSREDMKREQDAGRAVDWRLGQSIGDGIAYGFEVTANAIGGSSIGSPIITVTAGLAVNRCGQTVALKNDIQVSLLQPAAATAAPVTATFGDCAPPEEGVFVAGSGVYLLTVAPAQVKQGLALVSGLGNGGTSCNIKEVVEGVQFSLVQVTALSAAEMADEAHLQNAAAWKFFIAAGADDSAVRDPFGVAAAAQSLTATPLGDDDVPLALVHWTDAGGLRWVDQWPVRRRLAMASDPFLLPDARQAALGEAVLRQFYDQIQAMRTSGQTTAIASDVFNFLPPVGLLPLGGIAGAVGFDSTSFFTSFTTRGPLFIEGARVPPLLRLAATYPPIAVGDPELVWLYLVRENRQPAAGLPAAQPYLIFALGRLPCQVVPRFDVSHWDYANIALDSELTGS